MVFLFGRTDTQKQKREHAARNVISIVIQINTQWNFMSYKGDLFVFNQPIRCKNVAKCWWDICWSASTGNSGLCLRRRHLAVCITLCDRKSLIPVYYNLCRTLCLWFQHESHRSFFFFFLQTPDSLTQSPERVPKVSTPRPRTIAHRTWNLNHIPTEKEMSVNRRTLCGLASTTVECLLLFFFLLLLFLFLSNRSSIKWKQQ